MIRTGIMGGTFDPIHFGHLGIAKEAMKQHNLDEVWFMPSGHPPHKNGKTVSDNKDREAMVKLAMEGKEGFIYSDFEINQTGLTYTAETLTSLCKLYPDRRFFYIVGADSLCYMERWYHPEIIFKKAVVLAAERDTQTDSQVEEAVQFLKEKFKADIRLVTNPLFMVSSTKIRELSMHGESIHGLVPDSVEAYILEHGLYRENKIQ